MARGAAGAVASGHCLATDAAIAVLNEGGNAIDAAVAGALVLSVVCPYACTLAGDVYALVYDPAAGVVGLNGTGRSPAAVTRERFTDGIPRDGAMAVTVPGLLDGLACLLASHGTFAWKRLVAPAVALAREGFPVNAYFRRNLEDRKSLLARDPGAAALFLPAGVPLAEASLFRQPDLADILDLIADEGAASFYHGTVADLMLRAGAVAGWLVGRDDLAAHRSLTQKAISAPFYGHDVWTMPPNSYGATLLFQLLALEECGIAEVDPDSAEFVVRGYEARRSAYKAAGRFIGDPEQLEEPLRQLLDQAIAARRIDDRHRMPAESLDRCTTNVTVVDRQGLAVSLIQSISAPWGAGVVLPGTGILLNNRLAGFNNDPASGNCIAPRKRPAHTLAPCMVTTRGSFSASIGTPGTVGQTCTLAQFLARTLACRDDAMNAIDRPRWSVDFQGRLIVEETMSEALRADVLTAQPEARTMPNGWISFGSIKMAQSDHGQWIALADHRRSATAAALN